MRLTRQTNYAIRILMYCASNGGKLSRIREIAAAYSASELFLFKILQPLVEAGMVETIRGRNGGIRLKRAAAEISLRDVVEVTEESFALAECFEVDGIDCPLIGDCGLNSALHRALEAFLSTLGQVSIADLAANKGAMRRRLGLHAIVPAVPHAAM